MEVSGPTEHTKHRIENALTAFLCLVDYSMLNDIRDYTVKKANRGMRDSSWDLTVDELKAFIGIVCPWPDRWQKYEPHKLLDI